ncbi:MAG: hypothetical protein FWF29_07575, partial [Treponema sp.]|nr:hypothetical protein [Treponema sp.]
LSGSATATNVLSFSGSGTNSITLTLNLKPAFGEIVTIAYNAGEGNIRHNANSNVTVASFSLPVTLIGFNDSDHGRPSVLSVEIDAQRSGNSFSIDDAKLIYVTFNKPVQAASSQGFSVTGSATAQRITAISGSGTDTLILTMDNLASWSERNDFKLTYNRSLGNVSDTNNNLLMGFTQAITLSNYDEFENDDTDPPKIVSGLIRNDSPGTLTLVFNKPVMLDANLFRVKVHGTAWIGYANATPPAGGTTMDIGIVTRTVTAATPVTDTNYTQWNLAMSDTAKWGEILRVATTASGAAKGISNDLNLPVIPQFIVRSEVKRVKQAYEAEPGFYRNGVKDSEVTDGEGGQMYNNIISLQKLGPPTTADNAKHPQPGEIITIVLDSDQTATSSGPWADGLPGATGSIWDRSKGLRDKQLGGATIIFTTTTANANSANPKKVYINVNPTLYWAHNNMTMVLDENIVVRRDPAVATRSDALIEIGDGGKLILDGGEISGNRGTAGSGGALRLGGGNYGGIFLFNSGKITDNIFTSSQSGAAGTSSLISINQTVIVVMHGGEISGNSMTVTATPLSPRGGVISHFDNSAQNHGKSNFYMTGGEIKGNSLSGSANYNVPAAGAVMVNGTFMKVGGTIYGNEIPDPALANRINNFTHTIRPGAVAVLTTWNGTIANITLAQSVRRDNTSGPEDVLVIDCSKPNNASAGVHTIPDWITSYWDSNP